MIELTVQTESLQKQADRSEAEVVRLAEEKLAIAQKFGELRVQLEDANRHRQIL